MGKAIEKLVILEQTAESGLRDPAGSAPFAPTAQRPRLWQFASVLRRRLTNQLWLAEARLRGLELGARIILNGRPYLHRFAGSRIALGDRVCLNSSLRSNPLGCARPVSLRTMRPSAEIILGPRVGLSGTAVCAARRIEIGEGTFVGADAMIFDNDFHSPVGEWCWGEAATDNPKPVVIGRGVFIGARAIILKGVTIGDRAIVGAGAVVTRNVPARHIAVGNPARNQAPPASPRP
jgi:acetyltransferase-like isoleucine patch superfamily enzyme